METGGDGSRRHIELCDRPLDQVALATTHSSMSGGHPERAQI